jgi:molybdenum cofactor cytidylyltransferase
LNEIFRSSQYLARLIPHFHGCGRVVFFLHDGYRLDVPRERSPSIGAVVLAAGSSTRFGALKMLAQVGGVPLVRCAVENVLAAGFDPVAVVLGRASAEVAAALGGLPLRLVENARFRQGMSTSIALGVAALPEGLDAAAICLADQPGVGPGILEPLVAAFRSSGKPIAAPVYQGVRGNPVVFAAGLFPELRALSGDRGARDLLAARAAEIAAVPFDFPMPRDIDTPEDYAALLRSIGRPNRS